MKKNKVTSLVIADDHQIFRDGLKLLFKKEADIELVGEAGNGKELVNVVKATQPLIVMTDIIMPEMDGIEAVKKILEIYPDTKIIALTMIDEEDTLVEILEAGALGYLLKNADKDEIIEAIDSVKRGNPYFSKSISPQLIKSISASAFNPYKGRKPAVFTEKELQIIQLICQEKTSKEIGEMLYYSMRTIEWDRARIMEKMEVKSIAGIVIYAIKNKLFKI